jgi:DNA-binding FadR family transcriptional regulator
LQQLTRTFSDEHSGRMQDRRYQSEYCDVVQSHGLAKSHVEHDRVVEAILRGEHAIAGSAMYAHIVTVRDEYETYSESL